MATVQDRKAPSAGTKVEAGQNAPVTREGAGFVASDSLAAESSRNDGGFAENRRNQPDPSQDFGDYTTSPAKTDASGAQSKMSDAGGFDDPRLKDGLAKALESEPGSADDPSRLAEAQMRQAGAARPSVTGNNQSELSTGTAYDPLSRRVSS
ncbi:hypothetical protein L249_1912 [Ophiocordyceps polyrhachis-furcata BCC 54312]|uniref:Uncharacterized protein n=1 Tax=Ophiocordyceps polyrhachis-furcata BCC 54312 TaxID=1330021 RepID=A0A367LPQ9_9HYPO|nr:hypothetical protein L249_1912 [Ophiocordyceps polyrhachis-furcata BCC 54312]